MVINNEHLNLEVERLGFLEVSIYFNKVDQHFDNILLKNYRKEVLIDINRCI